MPPTDRSRRDFLRTAAGALAAASLPLPVAAGASRQLARPELPTCDCPPGSLVTVYFQGYFDHSLVVHLNGEEMVRVPDRDDMTAFVSRSPVPAGAYRLSVGHVRC